MNAFYDMAVIFVCIFWRLAEFVFFLSSLLSFVDAQKVLDLTSLNWKLSNGYNVTVPARLPSQAHLDLYAAGVIEDPLYGFNDVDQLWVERSNWTYVSEPIEGLYVETILCRNHSRSMRIYVKSMLDEPATLMLCVRENNNGTATWLVFEGLDTFVEIKLCNTTVANTANQFRQYYFEVSSILASCTNPSILSMNFGSAAKIVLDIAKLGPGKESQQ